MLNSSMMTYGGPVDTQIGGPAATLEDWPFTRERTERVALARNTNFIVTIA